MDKKLHHVGAESARLFARARSVLVGGVNSPVRSFHAVGGQPVFVQRAEGAHMIDVDGHRYIDLVGSWGPAIGGHAHPQVVEAVQKAAADGLSFGACCAAEAELAELILSAFPSCEMIRFVNSGTEAVMSAVRLARAATTREKILKFEGCYHGHVDALLVSAGSGAATMERGTPDSAGVPESSVSHTLQAAFNDLSQIESIMMKHGDRMAAVLVEPIAGNMGMVMPERGFLEKLRELCDRHGCLLIFDEVMTGFRVCWGGYQNVCGVMPDITCLGKIIGGGMPVAAYAASRKLMSMVSPLGPMYQAGTLSGNPLGMAAGLATLKVCQTGDFYERLNEMSTRWAAEIKASGGRAGIPLQSVAFGGMLGMFFSSSCVRNFSQAKACDAQRFAAFFHGMLSRRVWLPPSPYEAMFLSSAHTSKDIDAIVHAATETFQDLRA